MVDEGGSASESNHGGWSGVGGRRREDATTDVLCELMWGICEGEREGMAGVWVMRGREVHAGREVNTEDVFENGVCVRRGEEIFVSHTREFEGVSRSVGRVECRDGRHDAVPIDVSVHRA